MVLAMFTCARNTNLMKKNLIKDKQCVLGCFTNSLMTDNGKK